MAAGAQSVVNFTGLSVRRYALYKLSKYGFIFNLALILIWKAGEVNDMDEGQNAMNDYAFFITSEIRPTEKINIRPGLRIIENSVYDAPAGHTFSQYKI